MGAIDAYLATPSTRRQRRPLKRAAVQRAAVPAARHTARRIQRRAINQGFPENAPIDLSVDPGVSDTLGWVPGKGENEINLSPEMMTALAEPLSDIGGQGGRKVFLHELAHTAQSPELSDWQAEGLAELFAKRMGNQLGITAPPFYTYPQKRQRLRREFSPTDLREMIFEGQFGSSPFDVEGRGRGAY